jgi:hypothetical protein
VNAETDRMLELLYGLTDTAETAALRDQVQHDPQAAKAFQDAERMKSLLARASKLDFSQVSFQPPTVEVKQPERKPAGWLPWMVAAGVMLLIGTPIASIYLSKTDNRVDVAALAIHPDPPPPNPVQPPPVVLPGRDIRENAPKERSVVAKSSEKVKFKLLIIGPEKPAAGKESTFSVTAVDATGKPVKIRVTMMVKDDAKNVYFKEVIETDKAFTLPAAAWEKFPATGVALIAQPSLEEVNIVIPLR